ncbi:MAG: DNA adenine methylase [Gammaproteobacteria bacterium]|nr:DNA adenine methylase [Gammaproteobacteria bacterium]
MKYMGSKNRHAKELLPIILKNRRDGQCYVEPFVGGANMIDKVSGWRIGADKHEYLIALLISLSEGWEPPNDMSEKEYQDIKNNMSNYPKELVGFAGFPCSYGAKWFGGYCRGRANNGEARDYIGEAWRNVVQQSIKLQGIDFRAVCFRELILPEQSIIYCDPPYASATKYRDKFDHDDFWRWCREMVNDGHDLFASEYKAPDDFICIWEKQVNSSLTKDTGAKNNIERLFQHRSQIAT